MIYFIIYLVIGIVAAFASGFIIALLEENSNINVDSKRYDEWKKSSRTWYFDKKILILPCLISVIIWPITLLYIFLICAGKIKYNFREPKSYKKYFGGLIYKAIY